MEGVRIYGTIPTSLKEAMDKKILDKELKLSDALTLAIRLWVYPIPAIVPVKATDLISTISQQEQEQVNGLIIPDPKDEFVVDPEIKQSFHLGEIKSGPGIVQRLKAAGISAQAVINSRRAKNAGRDYDKSLEQYFELV